MVLQPQMVMRTEQRLVMTAMLQQAIGLLPLTRMELQQTVQNELLENPALEEAVDDIKEVADGEMPEVPEDVPQAESDERGEIEIDWENIVQDNYGAASSLGPPADDGDFPSYEQTLSKAETLQEHLEWQLSLSPVAEPTRKAALQIIWNVDESGYFRADLDELAVLEGISPEEMCRALKLVQDLDPPGVAARSLQECLDIQLANLALSPESDAKLIALARALIAQSIDRLDEKTFPKLAKANGVEVEDVEAAVALIRTLDPEPGSRYAQQRVEVIEPDVTVSKRGDDFEVVLNDEGLPPLRVSGLYSNWASDRNNTPTEARRYLDERVRAAVWFLKSIEQRRQTILKVTHSIVSFQRDFLDHGVSHLRPLVLRDVAEDIGMHESTVSRVTTGKYMETPQGVYSFKYFFHSGLESLGGGNMSSVAVREQIRKLVGEEDRTKPLTDQQIVEKLRENGIVIARRTVTKYRKEMRIAAASKRKSAR